MPETVQSLFDQLKGAAELLGDSETIDLITAVKNQTSASKLRFLIVGATGSGRFSTANVLLGQSELLPISPILKASIPVNINYSETITAEVVAKNGLKKAIPIEQLQDFLFSPDTDAATYQSVEVQTNSDFLKTCSLRIETIVTKRESNEWKEIFAGTDYTILVLRADAILSRPEKDFVRNILIQNFGLERVIILLNQIDLIPEDEQQSISEFVKTFLGSFESQPILIEFSAAKINKSDNKSNERGYEALMNLLKSDLLQNSGQLKSKAMRQAVEICLTELEQAAARQNVLIATNEAELQELLKKIDTQNQWLQKRIERAHNKVEGFINTLIKEELFREIENFSLALKEQLAAEIMPIEDITAIKRHLPGYFEALWSEFFNVQQFSLRSKLMEEMKRISETIKADLKEMLGDTANNFQNWLSEFDPTPTNMINFLMPKRGENTVGNVATTLELGGFLLLIVNLPIGLTSMGVGAITRMIGKKSIQTSEKKAIVDSAMNTINELEQKIKKQVDSNFSLLTKQLKSSITDLYEQELTKVRHVLEKSLESKQELIAKKEDLTRLISVTIPNLRELLEQII